MGRADREEREPASVAELPALLVKLAGDAVTFLEERLRLAEEEWRNEVHRLKSVGAGLAIAFALGFIGLGLLSAGILLLLTLLGVPAWALLTGGGLVYLAVAAALVARFVRAIERPTEMFTRSLGEIEKDKEWIQGR